MSELGAQLEIVPIVNGWQLSGELDAHTATALTQTMSVLPDGEVIVDLADVSFVDSSGLRVLLDATNRARGAGGDLVIASPQASIRRLIDISGLRDHIHVRE
jgi:anti-anti-sigma factor